MNFPRALAVLEIGYPFPAAAAVLRSIAPVTGTSEADRRVVLDYPDCFPALECPEFSIALAIELTIEDIANLSEEETIAALRAA